MESEAEGKGVREILLLVSPICEESLEAVFKLRKLISGKGYSLREVSILEREGLRIASEYGIKRIPAAILGNRILFQGKIPEDLFL